MDQSITPHSALLQSRLRDHKAETARSRNQSPQTAPDRRLNLARDDDIFMEDEPAGRANKSVAKRNSPAAPSAWRYDREPPKNRPSNNNNSVASGTGTNPRAMGAREMEDHIDKLSKQNFDLKMEVFHRREKIDQLERKLTDYAQLEEDLTNTLDANEELVSALEARDRAIDEAVVMITDLEQKNRELEELLVNAKVAAAVRKIPVVENSTIPASPGRKSQKTPRKTKDRRSLRNSVSPDVSARMIELANAANELEDTPGPMPSFLKSNAPTTAALRSMYVEGDQVVRPLPSHATLLSSANPAETVDYPDGLKSPGLSELSDSDLKSLYKSEQPKDATQNVQDVLREKEHATQNTNARVSKWVAERAVSPTKSHRSRKSSGPEADEYQSLDHVVKKQADPRQAESVTKSSRGRQTVSQRPEKDGHTPPMSVNPVFGQNIFPPTPDTMVTRPSNNSTNSFLPEKTPTEATGGSVKEPPQQPQANTLLTPTPRKYNAPSSMLPMEFDAYESPPLERKKLHVDSAGEYSDDPPRGYSSDGSFTHGTSRGYSHRNQGSLTGTTVIGAQSIRDAPPAIRSPSPPQALNNRPKLGVPEYPVLPYRAFGSAPRDRHNQGNSSSQATPTNMSYASVNQNRPPNNPPASRAQTQTQGQPPPPPLSLVNGGPLMPQNGVFPSPAAVATSPPTSKTTKSLAARTASIRDRFLRRKTTPIPSLEPVPAQTEAPRDRRSNSITRHFRFRRSSSEHGAVPTLTNNSGGQYPFPSQSANTINSSFASSTGKTYTVYGPSSVTLPSPPQRSQSERHRPSRSITGQSDRSVFSSSSSRINGPVTPDGSHPGAITHGTTPPGASYYASRQRRPSYTGRASSGSRSANLSNTDIHPIPDTPTDLRWESEPESASRQSRWRFGSRSRSNSRTREPTFGTLASHDGTSAGRRI